MQEGLGPHDGKRKEEEGEGVRMEEHRGKEEMPGKGVELNSLYLKCQKETCALNTGLSLLMLSQEGEHRT